MDPLSLRVALTAVASTLVVLSYFGVYRRSRSRYSAWWSVSLVASAVGSALYLLNGTAAQAWANPAGSAISVLGATCTWEAAAALRGVRHRLWLTAAPALITLVAALMDDPATDVWAGAEVQLACMAATFGLAAVHMRRLLRERSGTASPLRGDRAVRLLGGTVTAIGALYAARLIGYVAVGPDSPGFTAVLGTVPTTLLLIVALVVVTFTMTELAEIERNHQLSLRATVDPLTGLINREEFELRATARLHASGVPHTVVFADLDHFKAINDTHGHAAGDEALRMFATASHTVLGADAVVARMGGEEFAALLPHAAPAVVRERLESLSAAYASLASTRGVPGTTVSYGIATVVHASDLADALARADAAMYRAKRGGRDRAEVDSGGPER